MGSDCVPQFCESVILVRSNPGIEALEVCAVPVHLDGFAETRRDQSLGQQIVGRHKTLVPCQIAAQRSISNIIHELRFTRIIRRIAANDVMPGRGGVLDGQNRIELLGVRIEAAGARVPRLWRQLRNRRMYS